MTGAAKRKRETSVLSAVAERLRFAARERGVGELASAFGVTTMTWFRWTHAQADPGIEKLREIAEELQVSLAWLITGEGPMNIRRARQHSRLADYVAPAYSTPQVIPRRPR